jgi:hypothetical protein
MEEGAGFLSYLQKNFPLHAQINAEDDAGSAKEKANDRWLI